MTLHSSNPIIKGKALELLEKARAAHAARMAAASIKQVEPIAVHTITITPAPKAATFQAPLPESTPLYSAAQSKSGFIPNAEQAQAIEAALQGKSFCLIGAAGTGKTSVTQEIISLLEQASHVLPFAENTKHLTKGEVGIAIVGYTNKAVNNIRKKLAKHLQSHCITIHKLLEYAPVWYDELDSEGIPSKTMRFEPTRNAICPLPHISTMIFEESSMIGTDLFGQIVDALPAVGSRTQMIFLGDLNQLPPVFGPSILGFKLAELPVIELKHVYRQALQSPIISLATAIRTNSFTADTLALPSKLTDTHTDNREAHGNLTIKPWKKRIDKHSALLTMVAFMNKLEEAGGYDPEADQILCPYNKSFGTIELNLGIADYLGKKRGALVHEVLARYTRSYWAVGDQVLVDRHDAIITEIYPTPGYVGKPVAEASTTLDRWGRDPQRPETMGENLKTADQILAEIDKLATADEDAKNLASHTIKVYLPDLDQTQELKTAGEINSMLFRYALTVHKSQGSEWRRVFVLLHNSHAAHLSRELLYTAVTRAREELYIVCEGDIGQYKNSIKLAAERPVIPGVKLEEKIAYFKGQTQKMRDITKEAE